MPSPSRCTRRRAASTAPLFWQRDEPPARLLSRDLLYTAVTRARELLVVVGETAIVQAMIENGRKTRRYSGLRARLAGEV